MQMQPITVVLRAHLPRDKFGRCKVDKKGRPDWDMPRPAYYAPHWINPKKKAEALAKDLDLMTAGVGYAIHVPVFRGLSNSVFKDIKNRARRKAAGRYVW